MQVFVVSVSVSTSTLTASTCLPFTPTCDALGNDVSAAPVLNVDQPFGYSPNSCAALCQETTGCLSYAVYIYYGYCALFGAPVSQTSDGAADGPYHFWDIACIKPAVVPQICGATVGLISPIAVLYNDSFLNTTLSVCQTECQGWAPCLTYSMDDSNNCILWGGGISQ